jgi:hypothetical protein
MGLYAVMAGLDPAIHVDPQEPPQAASVTLSAVMVGEGRP